jgi:copper chaperone CopZ
MGNHQKKPRVHMLAPLRCKVRRNGNFKMHSHWDLHMETLALGIGGMQSGLCAGNIEKRLYGVHGVQSAAVSFSQEGAEIVYDPTQTNAAKLVNAIAEAGYAARMSDAVLAAAGATHSAPALKPVTNSGCG